MAEGVAGEPGEDSPLAPGAEFRGMVIEGLIARGGMGLVYKARRPGSERRYAVKILQRAFAEEAEFQDRFAREVRAMAGLKHPNIVGVHDYGVEDGLAFLVMDFVEGRGLRQMLRKGRLPVPDAVRIAGEVLEALGAAHEQGVVHRDIKPDNVLMDPAGTVKITDFGLAKVLGADVGRPTESDIVVGTPHYMAPEQMERPREVDRRADVYSFGVLFYEMLTGGLPIGRFALPSEKGAGNAAIDDLVLRCLEAEPDKRFPDALSLKEAFLRATGLPDSPPPRLARERHARNVPLTCGACSWTFYISATERGMAKCPTCRAAVPIVSGGRPSAPTPAPRPPEPLPETLPLPRRTIPWAVVGVSGALLLGGLVLAIVLLASDPPAPEDPPVVLVDPVPARTDPAPLVKKDPEPAPPSKAADADVDYDARIERGVQQCNMAGLVVAALLHSGKLDDCLRLDDQVAQWTREIQLMDRRRAELGRKTSPVPPHVLKGDRLFGLDLLRLESPKNFAEGIRSWLRNFKPGDEATLSLTRAGGQASFLARFPERSPELVKIARLLELELGEGEAAPPPPPPPPEPKTLPLPPELLAEIERKLRPLPASSRERVLSAHQDRARRLLKAPAGTAEDVDFLRQRILGELIPAAVAEIEEFRARVAELEPRALADADAGTDVVVFKDGRRLEGELMEAPDGRTRLVSKGRGSIPVRKEDILRVEKGKNAGKDFAARWPGARGKAAELDVLLAWCADQKLKDAGLLTAYELLSINPAHERARKAVGYTRDVAGAWSAPEPKGGADGTFEWQGHTYTREAFEQQLRSRGYAQINGLWHSKERGVYEIANLYRDAEKLTLRGGQILPRQQNVEDRVYDLATRSFLPRQKKVETGLFVGGSPLLEIRAPGEILECYVMAKGQVLQAGSALRVFAVNFQKDPAPKLIYSLNGPGKHDKEIDISEKVRGGSVFYLAAELGPHALFLPCDSNDSGILKVRYVWAQPLRTINELLGARSPAVPSVSAAELVQVEDATRRVAESHAEKPILDMMREMRAATEFFRYPKAVDIPTRFQGLAAQIEDPLRPRLESRGAEELLRTGAWWGSLSPDDRRQFATVYGLWCACARTMGK